MWLLASDTISLLILLTNVAAVLVLLDMVSLVWKK
jgi:hypothetical protein